MLRYFLSSCSSTSEATDGLLWELLFPFYFIVLSYSMISDICPVIALPQTSSPTTHIRYPLPPDNRSLVNVKSGPFCSGNDGSKKQGNERASQLPCTCGNMTHGLRSHVWSTFPYATIPERHKACTLTDPCRNSLSHI